MGSCRFPSPLYLSKTRALLVERILYVRDTEAQEPAECAPCILVHMCKVMCLDSRRRIAAITKTALSAIRASSAQTISGNRLEVPIPRLVSMTHVSQPTERISQATCHNIKHIPNPRPRVVRKKRYLIALKVLAMRK